MAFNFLGDVRFEKAFSGPAFSAVVISKSLEHCPGEIFTSDTDYKTRQYATFAVDDPDAAPRSHVYAPALGADHTGRPRMTVLKKATLGAPLVRPLSAAKESRNASCKLPFKKTTKELKRIPTTDDAPQPSVFTATPQPTALRGSYLSKPKIYVDPQTDHNSLILPEYHPLSSSEGGGAGRTTRHGRSGGPPPGLSDSTSELSGLPPPHQIHNRMMGWKLTSPERRRELLRMLENAQLSASTVEEDDHQGVLDAMGGRAAQAFTPGEAKQLQGRDEARRIAQRQAEAIEMSIG